MCAGSRLHGLAAGQPAAAGACWQVCRSQSGRQRNSWVPLRLRSAAKLSSGASEHIQSSKGASGGRQALSAAAAAHLYEKALCCLVTSLCGLRSPHPPAQHGPRACRGRHCSLFCCRGRQPRTLGVGMSYRAPRDGDGTHQRAAGSPTKRHAALCPQQAPQRQTYAGDVI